MKLYWSCSVWPVPTGRAMTGYKVARRVLGEVVTGPTRSSSKTIHFAQLPCQIAKWEMLDSHTAPSRRAKPPKLQNTVYVTRRCRGPFVVSAAANWSTHSVAHGLPCNQGALCYWLVLSACMQCRCSQYLYATSTNLRSPGYASQAAYSRRQPRRTPAHGNASTSLVNFQAKCTFCTCDTSPKPISW